MVGLYNQGVNTGRIYRKYAALMGYTATQKAFYLLLKRHILDKHNVDVIILPQDSNVKLTPATIENFGKRMLELGMAKIENLDPSQVPLKDVISAQKLVLDSKKLKMSENALEIMMSKLFGPQIDKSKVLEGELV